MARRGRRDRQQIDAMIAAIYPISRQALRSRGIADAQDEIAAAVMSTPPRTARGKRWQWLARPRHVMLVGAVLAGLGGTAAAAATLLSAHTGKYPTKMGIPINMSGPGEDLNSAGADFCRVAFQVTRDIPFPARYASWRDWVFRLDFGINHPSSRIPCSSRTGGHITTGWLGEWAATTAFCAWAQAWAQDDGAGNRAAAVQDSNEILHALDWRAVRWVDPHPSDAPAGDAPGGDRTKTAFGWLLFYQQAVRSGNRARVENLLDGNVGYGECATGADPDILSFLQRYPTTRWPVLKKLLLQHLRSEGI